MLESLQVYNYCAQNMQCLVNLLIYGIYYAKIKSLDQKLKHFSILTYNIKHNSNCNLVIKYNIIVQCNVYDLVSLINTYYYTKTIDYTCAIVHCKVIL